ncbi:DUF6747 family protein [Arenibacter aquaticus]|uniref:DUF6747 family protein n=1 Tax=Arenibacter aquaticus TaxID=2489054 RepID=UPI002938F3C8|nr:DUF6747 family protein [Arenibacter aquaticus]
MSRLSLKSNNKQGTFKGIGNHLIANGFKIYFWVCTVFFMVVLYHLISAMVGI